MPKALIVYGATTGNTESTAHMVAKAMAEQHLEARVMDVNTVQPGDFANGYDVFLFGCSAWGDEEIELQGDFAEFYEGMDELNLNGKKIAVFGCGDSSYTHFCGAVDAIEEKAEELGAGLLAGGLKIDGDPDDSEDEIVEWAHAVADGI
jgi:flavodoxin I